jgi:proteic killer suppression protein
MELAFRTRHLRSACEDEKVALQDYGEAVAATLRRRLADLRAADHLGDLVVGQPDIIGVDPPTAAFNLTERWRLFCRPNHKVLPVDANGAIDWSRIRRLLVTDITEVA